MARAFDGIDSSISLPADGVTGIDNDVRSWMMWSNVANTGVVMYIEGTALVGGSITQVTPNPPAVAGHKNQIRADFTGAFGRWIVDDDQPNDVWICYLFTYDAGATTNDPVFFVAGSSVASTETQTPTGSRRTGFDSLRLGENMAGNGPYELIRATSLSQAKSTPTSRSILSFFSSYSGNLRPPREQSLLQSPPTKISLSPTWNSDTCIPPPVP